MPHILIRCTEWFHSQMQR